MVISRGLTVSKQPDARASADRAAGDPAAELLGATVGLLRRLTAAEPAVWDTGGSAVLVSAGLAFTDGVGRAEILAEILRSRGEVCLNLWIEHNRVFAKRDGTPSDVRCFLNDYVASIRLPDSARAVPEDFQRSVVAGVTAAREGVRHYNRSCDSHWFRVTVVERPH